MTSLPLRASTPSTPLSGSYPGTGFRRRTLGRAASPPTWAWYEQIPLPGDDDDSSGSSSEDDEAHNGDSHSDDDGSEREHDHDDDGFEMDFEGIPPPVTVTVTDAMDVDGVEQSASAPSAHVPPECPEDGHGADDDGGSKANAEAIARKIAKGKQRAVEPPAIVVAQEQRKRERERKTRRKRHSEPAYRPILTIHRSQGFVWNQDLFVPSYIKDRYVTSTSPPGESCISLNGSSAPNPYDAVEVVEIRVTGQELNEVIP